MNTRTSIAVTACSNLEVERTVYSESNKVTLIYRNVETNLKQHNLSKVCNLVRIYNSNNIYVHGVKHEWI